MRQGPPIRIWINRMGWGGGSMKLSTKSRGPSKNRSLKLAMARSHCCRQGVLCGHVRRWHWPKSIIRKMVTYPPPISTYLPGRNVTKEIFMVPGRQKEGHKEIFPGGGKIFASEYFSGVCEPEGHRLPADASVHPDVSSFHSSGGGTIRRWGFLDGCICQLVRPKSRRAMSAGIYHSTEIQSNFPTFRGEFRRVQWRLRRRSGERRMRRLSCHG